MTHSVTKILYGEFVHEQVLPNSPSNLDIRDEIVDCVASLAGSMGKEDIERLLYDKFCAFFVKKDKNCQNLCGPHFLPPYGRKSMKLTFITH
jgi:hypothetical protein